MTLRIATFLLAGCLGLMAPGHAAAADKPAQARELDRALDLLAEQITGSMAGKDIRKIAVLEFPNLDGKVTDLGRFVTEELTTRLFRAGRFQLVERQLLKKVLEEQKFSASGLVDEATATRLGRLLGVDAIATGTIADLDTTVKINARLIATETGSVFSAATVAAPMSRELEKLLGRGPAGAATGRFDGTWDATFGCTGAGGGAGYTWRFEVQVRNGVLHGQYGREGAPASITWDGRIRPDGSAIILATGLTGDPKYNPGHAPKGTAYSYRLEASFTDTGGSGTRLESRPCEVIFRKR